jgi:hypothetical protein
MWAHEGPRFSERNQKMWTHEGSQHNPKICSFGMCEINIYKKKLRKT